MKANRITRINALVQRIVTDAGIEASKFANEGFTFDLRPATAYVINRHAARLPMKTSGHTLFHGQPAMWNLNTQLGCISIVAN